MVSERTKKESERYNIVGENMFQEEYGFNSAKAQKSYTERVKKSLNLAMGKVAENTWEDILVVQWVKEQTRETLAHGQEFQQHCV